MNPVYLFVACLALAGLLIWCFMNNLDMKYSIRLLKERNASFEEEAEQARIKRAKDHALKRPVLPLVMWERLKTLDLASVAMKLREEYPDWEENRVTSALSEYRKFLYLFGIDSKGVLVPWHEDLDCVWHAHILQMKKYQTDCKMLFGEMLYHEPTFSSEKEDEDADKHIAYTRKQYQRSFSPPSKAPANVAESYQLESFMPWQIWWPIFVDGNSDQVGDLTYNATQHSFQDASDAASGDAVAALGGESGGSCSSCGGGGGGGGD